MTDEEVLEKAAELCERTGTEHDALLSTVFREWKLTARMELMRGRQAGQETLGLAQHVIANYEGGERSVPSGSEAEKTKKDKDRG